MSTTLFSGLYNKTVSLWLWPIILLFFIMAAVGAAEFLYRRPRSPRYKLANRVRVNGDEFIKRYFPELELRHDLVLVLRRDLAICSGACEDQIYPIDGIFDELVSKTKWMPGLESDAYYEQLCSRCDQANVSINDPQIKSIRTVDDYIRFFCHRITRVSEMGRIQARQ